MINKTVFRNFKRRKTKLNMAWVDFRKAWTMVPSAWIIKALKLIGHLSPNAFPLLKSTMVDLRKKLISGDINLGEVNINLGIFQEDSSSSLLFAFYYISDPFNASFKTDKTRMFI